MEAPISSPRFSILLATRNGIRYLPYAIDSVLSQDFADFELVVSDNHSTDGTAEYLGTIVDPRFRHVRPDAMLPMALHFEFVITHARGTWITILGDDDGLLPFFFERLSTIDLDASGVDAVVFKRAYYYWDGCQETYGPQVISYFPNAKTNKINNKWALLLCTSSVVDYINLPQLYTTGLVKRSYVEAVKRKTGGRFFYGSSPDASSVVAFALHSKRHYRFEEPVFWVGSSPKSTGFSSQSKVDKSRAEEFHRLDQKNPTAIEVLPARIRDVFDLAIIFYEALLQNPATPRIWASRPVRNLFVAGLSRKNATFRTLIEDIYKADLKPFELRVYMVLVKIIALIWRLQTGTPTFDNDRSIHSEDRTRFPSMKEASACVLHLNGPTPGARG